MWNRENLVNSGILIDENKLKFINKLTWIVDNVNEKIWLVLSIDEIDLKKIMKNEDFNSLFSTIKNYLLKIENWRIEWISSKKLKKYIIVLESVLGEILLNEKMKDIIKSFIYEKQNDFSILLKSLYETCDGFIDDSLIQILKEILPIKEKKNKKNEIQKGVGEEVKDKYFDDKNWKEPQISDLLDGWIREKKLKKLNALFAKELNKKNKK